MSDARSFGEAWARAGRVPGWLTEAQARVLYDEARRVAPGRVVEIGSHLGRSTVVLAAGGGTVTAIDPFPPDWRYGRHDTEARLRGNLAAAGAEDAVDLRVTTSRRARAAWQGEVRLLYVDGRHDYWSCTDDLAWTAYLRPGDRFLVHDAFSSLGVTAAVLRHALPSRRHRFLGRTGSLARFEVAAPSRGDRARLLAQLPWFARNLVVKVLLRLRLRPLARLLGHEGAPDPY